MISPVIDLASTARCNAKSCNLFYRGQALYITHDPVHVPDLHATILHTLGIDHSRLTFTAFGYLLYLILFWR